MSAAEFEALFHARADSALSRFSDADVDFFRTMIPHHSQALEMSALVSDRTTNPSILVLAARIAVGQAEEIERMRQWLQHRGLTEVESPPADGAAAGPAETGDHQVHGMPNSQSAEHSMPGLLTPAEMDELAAAKGVEFDRLFLSYMIYHHQGAVRMVDELFSTDGGGKEDEVFRFAAEIRVDQSTEVARMERMLSVVRLLTATP
jgi:uncharacterized protein (DUF305 family)